MKTDTSTIPIRFRHFIPREESLKFFISSDESLVHDPAKLLKSVESDMMECSDKSRQLLEIATKAPLEPNWDLKRDFQERNKRLEVETLRAIARHCGQSMEDSKLDEEESDEQVEGAKELIAEELSEDEEDEPLEFRQAKNAMANISRKDLRESDELE